jgi:hypothetical protein
VKKRKQKDLSMDEIIRQFVRCAQRVEKASGGYMAVNIQFGPNKTPERAAQGKDGDGK